MHGFYGDKNPFIGVLEELLPSATDSQLPESWKGSIPLKEDQQSHKHWYIDSSKEGDDDDPQYGLESSTLAFFAGHGFKIEGWFVPAPPPLGEERVLIKSVRTGDESLRYFWLYSCGVLAHGPKVVKGARHYSSPQSFLPGRQDEADVFDRWTPAFGPRLRMVCGGSTNLGQMGINRIWNYLLNTDASVPDAWILGLVNDEEVPVCLARGGEGPRSSALSDRTIFPDRVTQKGWLHFQYPVQCDATLRDSRLYVSCPKAAKGATSEPVASMLSSSPSKAPLVEIPPSQAPAPAGKSLPRGFIELEGHENWKYHPNSGGVVFVKNRREPDRYSRLTQCSSPTQWTIRPSALLAQTGLDLGIFASNFTDSNDAPELKDFSFVVYEMRVESRQDGILKTRRCAVRNLFLSIHRKIRIELKGQEASVPIFGPAVTFELQRQGDEEPILASFSAPRQGLSFSRAEPEAIDEALAKRRAYDALRLNAQEYPFEKARSTFGYERAPLHCQQEFLRPTFEIQFPPAEAVKDDRPTVTVRVDARANPPEQSWQCQSWGDFPPPAP